MRDLFPATSFAAGSAALSSAGLDLLSQLLHMCPEKVPFFVLRVIICFLILLQRISAADALAHPWFAETPLPMTEDMMPKFKSKFSDDVENKAG